MAAHRTVKLFLRRNWLPAVAAIVVGGVLAGEAAFVAWAWPDDWEAAAQAALAAALVTVAGSVLSVPIKWAFDLISLNTEHRLRERAKILDMSYTYAAHYLMPLAGIAAELAKYLREFQTAITDDKKSRSLDAAFFSVAQYVRIQWALLGTAPLPGVDKPLGLFLKSAEREQRVWDLIMPPWALGIWGLQQESLLVQGLVDTSSASAGDTGIPRPSAFLAKSRDSNDALNALRSTFQERLTENPHLNEMIDVLTALNQLINYEVKSILDAWYTDTDVTVPSTIKVIEEFTQDVKKNLGIFYRVEVGSADGKFASTP